MLIRGDCLRFTVSERSLTTVNLSFFLSEARDMSRRIDSDSGGDSDS